MPMQNNKQSEKLAIDEAQERLNRFLEILLKADLQTIERLKDNNQGRPENKYLDNL